MEGREKYLADTKSTDGELDFRIELKYRGWELRLGVGVVCSAIKLHRPAAG